MMGKALQNNNLAALVQRAAPPVVNAIKNAAQKTGVNFAYLMEQAAVESSFRPDAKARTSSASGLYQFIERTWLGMVREHGEKYGLGDYADKIDARGRVKDPALRREILALRNDPQTASLMAAEFAAENKRYLEQFGDKIGEIGATELYLAHFMGAGGAAAFLKAHQKNPLTVAADIMPQAARANYNVFYNSKTGKPRTVAEVYAFFDNKFSASKNESMAITPAANLFDYRAVAPDSPSGRPVHDPYANFGRMAAGQVDEMLAPRAGPVLPEFSPFAHLNKRNQVRQDEMAFAHNRRVRQQEVIRMEDIRWNQPRFEVPPIAPPIQVAQARTGTLVNPAQIMMMGQNMRG